MGLQDLKINSFEEYQQQYQKSINQPELFWDEIASHFTWKKNGTRFCLGILKKEYSQSCK